MAIYTLPNIGSNISVIVSDRASIDEAMRSFERGSVEPTYKVTGQLWCCTDTTLLTSLGVPAAITEAYLRWNGSAWTLFADTQHPSLNAAGEIPMTGPLFMGTQQVRNLGNATAADHAPRFDQVVSRNGTYGLLANLDANNNRVINLAAPSSANDAARKTDVDAVGAVTGTFTCTPGGSAANVTLAFTPSRVLIRVARGTSGDPESAPQVFNSGAVDVGEQHVLLINHAGALQVKVATLTRRNGTPVVGFSFSLPSIFGANNNDVTVFYEAHR